MKNKLAIAVLVTFLLSMVLLPLMYMNPNTKNDTKLVDSCCTTTLMVTNLSKDSVTIWLTLSIYEDSDSLLFIQDVQGIFGILNSGPSGSFVLGPKDTLHYISTKALSGNLCFGGQPINCPDTSFPTGTNIFEFTINNNFGVAPQESVEISCVSGVNSYLMGIFSDVNWSATTGYDSIQIIKNSTLGNNTNRVGVFPTGCTNCTNTNGAPFCVPSIKFDSVNTKPICIIQRPANLCGGYVICNFKGFTPIDCNNGK